MSANSQTQRLDELKKLVAGAAAKERRNLTLSLGFTLLVLAVGLGWIGYAASKVARLKTEEARLNSVMAETNKKIEKQKGELDKISVALEAVQPIFNKIKNGQVPTKEEMKIYVAAISSAKESFEIVLNDPVKVDPSTASPSPTPPLFKIVPDVTKMAFTDADNKIRAAGFTTKRIDQPGKGDSGTVLYQDPLAGQRTPVNATVKLYTIPASTLSTAVPDLKGLTLEEASQRLRAAGLAVRKVDQEGYGTPGTVLYQDPFTGRRVPSGSQITIFVIPTGP
jgi:hypothetical protein